MLRSLALLSLCAGALTAQQSKNCVLLSNFDVPELCNDIWGYVEPGTGREFAILLSRNGTYIIETTDPTRPVQKAYFAASRSGWSNSTWRDARVYRNYVYVVTEGGGGMQIIDLADVDNPRFVKTWRGGLNWRNSHNIAIDTVRGTAWPCGTSGGTHVLDLSQDPENPRYLSTYTFQYVHDLHVVDGTAFLGEINRQWFRILDATDPRNLGLVGATGIRACHSAWPMRELDYAVTASESFGAGISVIDIRNQSSPEYKLFWRTGGAQTSPHNVFMHERNAHVSFYSEGYRCLEMSDPLNPVEVAYYDTTSQTSGFTGAWGCYPYQPSGNVYVSDIGKGLMVLKPKSTTTAYGVASEGAGGAAPRLLMRGSAYLGNGRFAIQAIDCPPNQPVFFVVGPTRANVQVQGLTWLVDGVVLAGQAGANGEATMPIRVPNNAGLDGLQLHAQAFVQDAGGPLGFAASKGMSFDVFSN